MIVTINQKWVLAKWCGRKNGENCYLRQVRRLVQRHLRHPSTWRGGCRPWLIRLRSSISKARLVDAGVPLARLRMRHARHPAAEEVGYGPSPHAPKHSVRYRNFRLFNKVIQYIIIRYWGHETKKIQRITTEIWLVNTILVTVQFDMREPVSIGNTDKYTQKLVLTSRRASRSACFCSRAALTASILALRSSAFCLNSAFLASLSAWACCRLISNCFLVWSRT